MLVYMKATQVDATVARIELDREAFESWVEESGWCDLDPALGEFELCAAAPVDPKWRAGIAWVAAGDVEALWAALRAADCQHDVTGVYLSTAPFVGRKRGRNLVKTVVEIVVDIDTREGVHASSSLPSMEQGLALVDSWPTATTVVRSGGGLHLRYSLAEPVSEAEARIVSDLIADCLVGWANRLGVEPDPKPTRNLAGVLRLPGSVNRKDPAAPVLVEPIGIGARWELGDLAAAFEPLRSKAPVASLPTTSAPIAGKLQASRPPTPFSLAVSPSELLLLIEPNVKIFGSKVAFPRADGSYDPAPSTDLCADSDGATRLLFHGTRVLEQMRAAGCFPKGQSPKQFTSEQWLLFRYCAGDGKLTSRLVGAFRTRDGWDLQGLATLVVEAGSNPEGIRAALDARGLAQIEAAEAIEADVAESTSLSDAIARGTRASIPLGQMEPARVIYAPGSEEHGIYQIAVQARMAADGPVPEKLERLTDYVIYRSAIHDSYQIDLECRPQPQRDHDGLQTASFDVTVIDSEGRRITLERVQQAHSLDIAKLVAASRGVSVSTPSSPAKRAQVRTVLERLEREGLSESRLYNQTGWLREDSGRFVYVLPGGSLDVDGARADIRVGDGGAVPAQSTPSQARLGVLPLNELQDAERVLPEYLQSMLAIASPRVMLPLVGQMLAGIMPVSRQGSLIVVGKRGSGKSLAAAAAQTLVSSAAPDGATFFATFGTGNTPAGLKRSLAWCRHHTVVFDDYRQFRTWQESEAVNSQLGELLRASYAAVSYQKSTKTLGVEQSATGIHASLITAEHAPPADDEGIRTRALVIQTRPGEIAADGGNMAASPITIFQRLCAEHPTAGRTLTGLLVTDMARALDMAGLTAVQDKLGARRAEVHAMAADLVNVGDSRLLEVGSTWMMGWVLLEAAVRALPDGELKRGLEAVIPSEEQRVEVYRSLIRENALAVGEGSIAQTLIAKLREMVAEKSAYLELSSCRPVEPGEFASLGWESNDGRIQHRSGAALVGMVSDDGKWVHITRGAFEQAKKAAGLGHLAAAKIAESLEPLTAESKPAAHRPAKKFFGANSWPVKTPGFTLPMSTLNGENDDDD